MPDLSAARALVTGGCGFVGSRLCRRLLAAGARVTVVDDLSLGTPAALPLDEGLPVELVTCDIRETELSQVLAETGPTHIFHLAAIHYIPACEEDPARAIDVNVRGTQCVLDACASAPPALESVVVASTGAVYAPDEAPHHEDSLLEPTDVYGHTKLWSEQLARLFHRRTEIPVGVARLFNVFGPGETNPHLIPTILRQVERSDELALGNLSTERDYVYVDDVADALARLALRCREHGRLTCNVGGERPIDGVALVEAIERVLGRRFERRTDEARLRASDRPRLAADCRRAHELLGWHAATSLEQGLAVTAREPVAAGIAFR